MIPDNTPGDNPVSPDRLAELTRVVLGLADDLAAVSDRLAYVEAAVLHLADIVGLDLPGIPDPLDRREPQ